VVGHWCAGTLPSIVPDVKACELYSSEYQVETLVRALEGLPAKEPFVPGAQAVPASLRSTIENKRWLDGVDV
jgi:hypothetical protein